MSTPRDPKSAGFQLRPAQDLSSQTDAMWFGKCRKEPEPLKGWARMGKEEEIPT